MLILIVFDVKLSIISEVLFSSITMNLTFLYAGVRIGPPPDLPSLLLHNRIVYIGMPLVPAVTELIIAELLYLNYEDTTKPITMYINSSGTTTADGRSVGFETEAFAIADVMKYVRPPVCTVAVGQAFGAAAMLLVREAASENFF
jgi:ATP-dependent Clp protease protease subunit